MCPNEQEFKDFVTKRGWGVGPDGETITFKGPSNNSSSSQVNDTGANATLTIAQTLGYATELERIV